MNFNTGVYTVIPTFFKDSEVDLEQLKKSINYQIDNKVKNIVLLGTTSEIPTLSNSEQELIVKTSWENFKGKINIIIGIGTNNTKTTLENAFKFRNFCDAYMITTPYYNKPSQEGIYQHFSTIAQLIPDKPIMLYNIPSRTGVSISPTIVANLYNSFDNIKAIKEASGNIQHSLDIKNLCDIAILSGDDALTLPLMSIGAIGIVSVASNIIPTLIVTLVDLFGLHQLDIAIAMNKKLYPFFKSLFLDTNPIPLKYLMVKQGLANDESVRLPLVKIQSSDIRLQLDYISSTINSNTDEPITVINST